VALRERVSIPVLIEYRLLNPDGLLRKYRPRHRIDPMLSFNLRGRGLPDNTDSVGKRRKSPGIEEVRRQGV
jgi:hypothetical protein